MERYCTQKLKEWKNKKERKPLLVKGARQVGKTYILKHFGQTSFPHFHYFNFEKQQELHPIFEKNLDPKRIVQELGLVIKQSIQIDQDLVIFDEIQHCPKALTSLKYFNEDLPQLALCAAGSLIGIYLSDTSFPVGMVDFLKMTPLSFEEFLSACGEKELVTFLNNPEKQRAIPLVIHNQLWDFFKTYLIVGGLPEVVVTYINVRDDLYSALSAVRSKQDNLIQAYYADIAKHSGKQNAMHVVEIWKNIPQQLSQTQDGSASKFKFKGVIPGASKYSRLMGPLHWLITAGMVIKVPLVEKSSLPLSAYAREHIFKLYVFDVGLLGALASLQPKAIWDYDYGSYKGFFAENFVAQEFRFSGVDPIYSWNEKTAEVEFLREIGSQIYPIEVKSGWVTKAKSLMVYAQKYAPPYRTIMSAHPLKIDPSSKVHRYPLYLASHFPLIA